MWVCVSDDFELNHLLVKILNSAPTSGNFKNLDIEQLQNHLRKTLAGQKFLLVLDDVWNEDHVKWAELKDLIQVGAQGSKVLVTTRSHSIATMMGTNSSYTLQGLSKKDSLFVFVKWAFKEGEESKYPKLLEFGKQIVQKCGGLPLALRTLGSSLFLKVDIKEWEFLRDNEIWNLPQRKDDILPALKLSYDQLPSYLKRCFACFSLFEKDHELYNLQVDVIWEALGFLPSPKKSETMEDVGNHILHELQSRSFLQDFIDYGSACTFKLHDLVHDLAMYVAEDEFRLLNSPNQNIPENILHLSFIKNDLLGQAPIPAGLKTILFPIGANNETFLNTVVTKCKYLRILDLKYSKYENFPRSISKLKHLRYLSLQYNPIIERLPDSICKLQNLHALLLNGCKSLQMLPKGLKNLISLRRLNITTSQFEFPDKDIAKLTSLEILTISDCHNLEALFEGIQLPSLKFLSIHFCGSLKSLPLHATPDLESLVIDTCHRLELSMGYEDQIPELRLKLLSFVSLPQLVTFPQWMQGSANTLHSLRIDDCKNLEELPKWLFTLNCLKTLIITDCPKLCLLPDDVHRLPDLGYLEIQGCPELCRRCQIGSGKDWPKISHIKEVMIEFVKPED